MEVQGKGSLEQSLGFYTQGELLEGDNQYFCEKVGRKVGDWHCVDLSPLAQDPGLGRCP